MSTEATQEKGASLNPREEMARSIAAKRNAPPVETPEEIETEELDEEAAALAEDDAPETEPEGKDKDDGPLYVREGRRFVKLKVDGEEREVEWDRLQSDYQKALAGDKRLQEAAAERQQLARERAEMQQAYQHWQQQVAASQPKVDPNALLNDALENLLEGDKDKALAALQQVINRPQIDPNEILAVADQRFQARLAEQEQRRVQNEANEADSWFSKEHADLQGDPGLKATTEHFIKQVFLEHNGFNGIRPRPLLEEAARRTREWIAEKGIGTAATDDRRDRKRQAASRALASEASSRIPKPPAKPKSKAEVIAGYAKARGIRPY